MKKNNNKGITEIKYNYLNLPEKVTEINVHSGQPVGANGTYNRGSQGCITLSPNDAAGFMGNFDWSGTYNGHTGNTGTSLGTIIIMRGDNATATQNWVENRRNWQQNPLMPITTPRPNVLR